MIVRVLGVGQFRLADDDLEIVQSADRQVELAMDAGDEAAFGRALAHLAAEIGRVGTPVAIDEFVRSDVVVPDPDTTLAEASTFLADDGMIPG